MESISQLAADLDERGYVTVEGLIPRDAALAAASVLQKMTLRRPDDASIFSNLAPSQWPPFLDMATHAVPQQLAEHTVGPQFKMIGRASRMLASPGERAQGLHVDLPLSDWFTASGRPFPENCACLQTIWTLTDFTAANGATEAVPFSHHARRSPRPDVDYDGYLVPLEAPAGSLVAFHSGIWHRRGTNRTETHRVGLSVPYIAQWLDPVTTGWQVMSRAIWEQLPEQVRRLNPHTAADE